MARKSKEDWFKAGMALLIQYGEDGLNIEKMAAQTGVTKGSFYHHFGNLNAYKTALLAHLERTGFADVVEGVDTTQPATEQIRQLTQRVSQTDFAQGKALRQWGERDEQARDLVRRLDDRRLHYLTELATTLTGDAESGRLLARMGYALYLGAGQLDPPATPDEYQRINELLMLSIPALRRKDS